MSAFDMTNVTELNLEDIVKPFKGLRIVKCPSKPSDHWSKTSRRLLEYQLQCSTYSCPLRLCPQIIVGAHQWQLH